MKRTRPAIDHRGRTKHAGAEEMHGSDHHGVGVETKEKASFAAAYLLVAALAATRDAHAELVSRARRRRSVSIEECVLLS